MKKHFLFTSLIVTLFILAFSPAKKSIVGHWKMSYGNGMTGKAQFNSDGTYEATFDGQDWKVGGTYKEDGGITMITDSVCGNGYWGKYKSKWYTDDSLRTTAIEDSCSGRKANADGAVMVRQK